MPLYTLIFLTECNCMSEEAFKVIEEYGDYYLTEEGIVARISPCYRGRNGSLMPIGHKGRFLLMVKMQKNETGIVETK